MKTEPIYIVAADTVIDGAGDLTASQSALDHLRAADYRLAEFEISTSGDGWHTALPENTFRGACSPMLAIKRGRELLAAGRIDAFVIHGRDYLKTDYQDNKEERRRQLKIYAGGTVSILEGYQKLADEFLDYWQLSRDDFRRAASAIFDNHMRVWRASHTAAPAPAAKWFEPVSDLFRGVDCANPSVDFEGRMVVVGDKALDALDFGNQGAWRISGCAITQVCEDGLETTPEIVPYKHLAAAYTEACREADVDFSQAFQASAALLEIYTCYPVVPMGFLLSTGLAGGVDDLIAFAARHPLTVTGGLNLAKAPYNNTTLQAFAAVTSALQSEDTPDLAGIHSVGALGYMQAFVVLERVDGVVLERVDGVVLERVDG